MKLLQPLSEDFLYWNPEDICTYPQECGIEDSWFIEGQGSQIRFVNEQISREVTHESRS